jgi:hypothetical protein
LTIPFFGVPNLPLDLRISSVACDNIYQMWLEFKWDLWSAPIDMFGTGDYLDGVNGILNASFTQGT